MALPFAAWLLYLSAHAPAKPRTCTCGEPRLPVLPWQGLRPEDRRRKEKPRPAEAGRGERGRGNIRSEEHTSELQSLMRISYAVFCLKKNNNKITNTKERDRHDQEPHKRHKSNHTIPN